MKVVLAVLAWNSHHITGQAVVALRREAALLKRSGAAVTVIGVNNGSSDSTGLSISRCDIAIHNPANAGISVARNQIIDQAARISADYLFLLDGDVVPIPGSVPHLLDRVHADPLAYCAGLYSFDFVRQESEATPDARYFHKLRVVRDEAQCALTQYGVYRMGPFHDGVRFPAGPPWDAPGWGLEDNWLHLDMKERGLHSLCLIGARYQHAIHSSWRSISQDDLSDSYHARKNALLAHWNESDEAQATETCRWLEHLTWDVQKGAECRP